VGGIKEKMLAARRARVTKIILPAQNRRDIDELPKETFKDIKFVFVENMRQVFREALKERIAPAVGTSTRPTRLPQPPADEMSKEIQASAPWSNPLVRRTDMGRRAEKINGQRNQSSGIYLEAENNSPRAIFGGLEWFDTPRPV